MATKTLDQVRDELWRQGLTVAQWSRDHGYRREQVSDVLHGRAKGRNGASHEIAVLLGVKDGDLSRGRR